MSNFRTIDRETRFLLPPSVDDWLPEKHLGGCRGARSSRDERQLSRFRIGVVSSANAAGPSCLRLCDGRVRAASWSVRPMTRWRSGLSRLTIIPSTTRSPLSRGDRIRFRSNSECSRKKLNGQYRTNVYYSPRNSMVNRGDESYALRDKPFGRRGRAPNLLHRSHHPCSNPLCHLCAVGEHPGNSHCGDSGALGNIRHRRRRGPICLTRHCKWRPIALARPRSGYDPDHAKRGQDYPEQKLLWYCQENCKVESVRHFGSILTVGERLRVTK
jgi:hypothetical protein